MSDIFVRGNLIENDHNLQIPILPQNRPGQNN
jgi:hypothetical protein